MEENYIGSQSPQRTVALEKKKEEEPTLEWVMQGISFKIRD
jgi:hypothetical protein